jgi:hypothetical protein
MIAMAVVWLVALQLQGEEIQNACAHEPLSVCDAAQQDKSAVLLILNEVKAAQHLDLRSKI